MLSFSCDFRCFADQLSGFSQRPSACKILNMAPQQYFAGSRYNQIGTSASSHEWKYIGRPFVLSASRSAEKYRSEVPPASSQRFRQRPLRGTASQIFEKRCVEPLLRRSIISFPNAFAHVRAVQDGRGESTINTRCWTRPCGRVRESDMRTNRGLAIAQSMPSWAPVRLLGLTDMQRFKSRRRPVPQKHWNRRWILPKALGRCRVGIALKTTYSA